MHFVLELFLDLEYLSKVLLSQQVLLGQLLCVTTFVSLRDQQELTGIG